MAEYPSAQRQNQWFAKRFLKMIRKEAVAAEIQPIGYLLLSIVADFEDDLRYRRPPRFWDVQFTDQIGCSRSQLQRIKKRLIDAGWLHCERTGSKQQGHYWVTIPEEYQDVMFEIYHAPEHKNEGVSCSTDATRTEQEPNKNRTRNISCSTDATRTEHKPNTNRTATEQQPNTYNHLPLTTYHLNNKREVELSTSGSPKPKRKFDSEDLETAKQLLAAIRERKPKTAVTPARLEAWAVDIRLLRTKDKNTTEEIREVLAWLPSHEGRGGFAWGDNVRSGKKLREHFPSLHAAMGKPELARQLTYQPWEGEARPEDDIAPF